MKQFSLSLQLATVSPWLWLLSYDITKDMTVVLMVGFGLAFGWMAALCTEGTIVDLQDVV